MKFKNLISGLLKYWCDGMLRVQINNPSNIEEHGALGCSSCSHIHGNRYIYTVLTKFGKADLAHQILTTPDFPSQAYVMSKGFTTWPERQFKWEKMEGPSNSLNHPMHSGFAAYFYESLGGVKSSKAYPGYKVFNVNPEFPDKITSTNILVPTPYGNIKNDWTVNGGVFFMKLTVPFNTKANIMLTSSEMESFKINDKKVEDLESQNILEIKDDAVVLHSGYYDIQYLKSK